MAEGYFVRFDPDFPLADVQALGRELTASGALAPGFIPPPAGFFDLRALSYANDIQKWKTIILPDRNLVSRMARVARDGHADLTDKTSRTALALMAFCQAMNIDIEPSIAFHELGAVSGNAVAHEELSWFRAADRGAAGDWIAVAAGRKDRVDLGAPAPLAEHDFEKPLIRWRRNYVVALKIAALELTPAAHPFDRARALVDWMVEDFLFAGPAIVYAAMYFGPRAPRKDLFKRLRAQGREPAIEGVRSAAWDITHLSDFILRVAGAEASRRQYIFASGDLSLAKMAGFLVLGPEPADGLPSLGQVLAAWWPEPEAARLAAMIFERKTRLEAEGRAPPSPTKGSIDDLIARGETWLRAWSGD